MDTSPLAWNLPRDTAQSPLPHKTTEATPPKEHCCAGVIATSVEGPTHGAPSLVPYIHGETAWELTHTKYVSKLG
jgi:hypothetical protein